MKIEFEVTGEPRGKERHRTGKYGTYTPSKTVKYEKEIQKAFRNYWDIPELPFPAKKPLVASITAYYKIPKSESKKTKSEMASNKIRPTKKPDVDNIAKVVAEEHTPELKGLLVPMCVQQGGICHEMNGGCKK